MAVKGTKKELSVRHEEFIAEKYGGVRSKSSGAAAHDQGDVRTGLNETARLIECKYSGSPGEPLKSTPRLVKEFEKIAKEAWSEGRDPMVAMRYYLPDSVLANREGWVDFAVRLVGDDHVVLS